MAAGTLASEVAPPRLPSDPLDEFAPESLGPAIRRRPAVWQKTVLVATALAGGAAAVLFVAISDSVEKPVAVIALARSPIEVEYPKYPGAPLFRTATIAVPARLSPETSAAQVSPAPQVSAPRPQDKRRRVPSRLVEPEARNAFDVRGAVPQLVSAVSSDAAAVGEPVRSVLADAPPRRIGPPLTLTTLGGAVTRNGRLALVLEVTEQGEVARVVGHEAVDVHPDVVDSISMAARGWRYEPARRDGVPVRAQLRVVVELNGGR